MNLHPRPPNYVPIHRILHPCLRRFGPDKFRWDQKLLLPCVTTTVFISTSLDSAGDTSTNKGYTINVSDTAHHHHTANATTLVRLGQRARPRVMTVFFIHLMATAITFLDVHVLTLRRRIHVGLHTTAAVPGSGLPRQPKNNNLHRRHISTSAG